jgi:hypothetical protein
MLRVKNPQDLGAGLVFIAIGLAGIYFGKDLPFGSAGRMGPGYFPVLLSYLIVMIGIVVAGMGLTIDGARIEPIRLRPIAFVVAAILSFGALISEIGLALSAIVLTLIAGHARPDAKLPETALLAAALAIFSVLIFVYGLGQALPPWWGR